MGVNSCGCFSLKTGTIIIAVLSILDAIHECIKPSMKITQADNTYLMQYNSYLVMLTFRGMVVAELLYHLIIFLLPVMLLIGALKGKAHFIFPYVSWSFLYILGCIAGYGGMLSDASVIVGKQPYGLAYLILSPAIIGLLIYLWLVVFYFYQKLLSEQVGHEVNLLGRKISRGHYNNVSI